jgi:metal-responsive CopG/Arc/MetJ family transcriptional regulator
MSEDKDPRIITPMPASLVKAIDDFRFDKRMPSRSEAIRRLIELGLEAAKTPPENAP